MKIHFPLSGLFTCIILCFAFPTASSGGVSVNKYNYTVAEGLPSNQIYAIGQDKSGFIWFGTSNGLSRFDGQCFRNYRKNDGSGLSNNSILHLLVDRDERIWVSLDTGVDVYLPEKDCFVHFGQKTSNGKAISGRAIDIMEDSGGDIWITTVNEGLFRYIPQKDSLISYNHDPGNPQSISQDYISVVYESHDGTIWLGTYNSGLCALDKNTGACRRYTREKDGLSDNSIDAITEDSYGNLWIGTVNAGINCMNSKTGIFSNTITGNQLYGIHHLQEISLGKLLICSENGAAVYNIKEGEISLCMPKDAGYMHTDLNSIYSFLKDRDGNLWFGSSDSGVEFYPSNNDFICYDTMIDGNSKAGKTVTSICEYENGKYWIGTSNNGIMLLDTQKETVTPYFLPSARIFSMMLEGNRLWTAAYDKGIRAFDLETGKSESWLVEYNDARVFSIYLSSNARIYAGAADGLYLYDSTSDTFVKIRESSRVTDIDEDKNGLIWISTAENGIYSYNPRKEEYIEYTHDKDDTRSICCNFVNSIVVDESNTLWIGTNDGLCSYDSGYFTSYADIDLPDENISQIISDNGRIWISTNNGLVSFTPDNGNTTVYRKADGLKNQQFSKNAGIRASTGQILFGTIDGVAMFSPSSMTDTLPVPDVLITELLIDNRTIYPYIENSPIDKPIERTEEIVLSHRQSSIGLRFASPCYRTSGNIRYRFRLDRKHQSDSWHPSEGHTPVYYNLNPGKYTFRVQATTGKGNWNGKETVLSIRVKAPLLRSSGAYAIYAMLVILCLSGVAMMIMRRNKERYKMRLDQLENKKEQELNEMKISFFTNVAHEIRTPLSLISGPLEYIMQDKEMYSRHEEYFNIIANNDKRLHELVNQLLDFNKATSGEYYSINYDSCCISVLLDRLVDMFSFTAEKRGITIRKDYADNMHMVIDKEALTKIVNNLLSNAVKYAEKDIIISAGLSHSGLSLNVEDDGPGIPEEFREKIFGLFYQVNDRNLRNNEGIGIGLHLVKMLISVMGGTISAGERNDKDGKPLKGTVFSLFIPHSEMKSKAPEESPAKEDMSLPEDNTPYEDTGMKRILAVDDSTDMIAFLKRILSEQYHVTVAYNGEDAMKLLEEKDFDMVISDVMMPGISGIELCRNIKNDIRTSHIHVILLTAKTDNQSKIDSLENGVDAYIEKPFSPHYLLAQINNLFKRNSENIKDYGKKPMVEIRQIARNRLDEEFIEKCNAFISANMSDSDLSVDTLARELALSRTAVFRKLKAITGMTPNDFMKFVRLNEAGRMLMEGRYSITEIGYITGFSSSSYFAKCFFRQFGILPSDFVKNADGEVSQENNMK